jgi:hypothetical protein
MGEDAKELLCDRMRLNRLAATLPAWADAAASKSIKLPGNRAIPPALAARVGVLAFGQRLVPTSGWKSAKGMAFAKRALLLLAEAELMQRFLASQPLVSPSPLPGSLLLSLTFLIYLPQIYALFSR